MPQMIVPGCEDCIGWNRAILDAEATENVDLTYDLECDLASHNETHTETENETRISWRKGIQ